MPDYIARPAGDGPWPGVVVIHEVWGLDDQARGHADRLAAMGFLAVAPDLFRGVAGIRCMISTFRALRAGRGGAFADIEAARRSLMTSPDCTRKVGIVGFCMGGGFALLCAGRGFDVAAPFYGALPASTEPLRNACSMVASYGGADHTLPGAAAELKRVLESFGIEHDVKEYPGAGFMSTERSGPKPLRPLLDRMVAGPDPVAAEDAWQRLERFFRRHLSD